MKCLDQKPITKLALTDFMARVKYNLVDDVSAELGPATHSPIGVCSSYRVLTMCDCIDCGV